MIPNEEKERWHYRAVKEYLDYIISEYKNIYIRISEIMMIFIS